jgi:hypothetical protein
MATLLGKIDAAVLVDTQEIRDRLGGPRGDSTYECAVARS